MAPSVRRLAEHTGRNPPRGAAREGKGTYETHAGGSDADGLRLEGLEVDIAVGVERGGERGEDLEGARIERVRREGAENNGQPSRKEEGGSREDGGTYSGGERARHCDEAEERRGKREEG